MATLSFWGGVGTVTGSKYLIETESARVLVDCGVFQDLKELRERNWQEPPFDPRSLHAVLITHAHIDHTGAAGTTGRRILNGEREVKILGQWVPVNCRIERIGSFSAHADWR